MKTLHLLIIAILIISVSLQNNFGFGQYPEHMPSAVFSLYTDKQNYDVNDTITVAGDVDLKTNPVKSFNIEIRDSYGQLFKKDIISVDANGTYNYRIKISDQNTMTGTYIVRVWNPNFNLDLQNSFQITNAQSIPISVYHSHPYSWQAPPLKQFQSGTLAQNVKCNQGFQLVIKSEDGSPVCVKPDTAIVLVENRWATNVSQPNPMTGLNNDTGIATLGNHAYYFETPNYTETPHVPPTQISFHDVVFTLFPSGFRGGLPVWGCGGGYYWANAKFSDGTNELLQIFVGSKDCFLPQPSTHFSTHTNPQAGLTFYDGKMKLLVSMENKSSEKSTIQNQTIQTTQIIPSCVSKISHQYAIAGPPGFPLCPVMNFQASGHILNATGFYGIYNYTKFPDTQNFVLEPGHIGTFTYKISTGSIYSWTSTPPANEINITNNLSFMHDAGMNNHPGVIVSVFPNSEMMLKKSSVFVTITFSASKDALPGTYWVTLPPGVCSGGEVIILTITDCGK